MPPLPGEQRLVTLYADVHYYFAKPITRPIHHRFDKASYLYVYYNSTRQTSRIEIANNPGTEFQDAFNGNLDKCKIRNSYTFPTLVTIEVEADGNGASPTSSVPRDKDEWSLETGNLNDTDRDKRKLHTLDVYFWTQEDAKLAVEFFKKLLGPSQLDIVESPSTNASTRHQDSLSPVVQNLENVAISDPAYRNGQTRNSQNQPQSQPIKLPPPPPPPQTDPARSNSTTYSQTTTDKSRSERVDSPASHKSGADFTPVAYNPAAPAAPEPRAHREKTPPPEDDTDGTGLKAAAAHDHAYEQGHFSPQPYTGQSAVHQPQYGHYGSPPPPSATSGYGSQPSFGFTSPPPPPPPSAPQQHPARSSVSSTAPSFAPPPVSTTPGYGPHSASTGYGTPSPQQHSARSSQAPGAMTFGPPSSNAVVGHDIHRHSSAAEHYTPDHFNNQPQSPVETPGTEFYRTLEQPVKPLQHIRPQYPDVLADRTSPAPPGSAYSQHAHGQNVSQGRYDSDPYAVHNQVYRPTEQETHSHRKPSRSSSNNQSAVSRIDSTADKLKGKFMKRFG